MRLATCAWVASTIASTILATCAWVASTIRNPSANRTRVRWLEAKHDNH